MATSFTIGLKSYLSLCIIVPEAGYKKEELTEMVQEVNETQVSVDEVLGEHVYYYDFQKDRITY